MSELEKSKLLEAGKESEVCALEAASVSGASDPPVARLRCGQRKSTEVDNSARAWLSV